MRLLLYNIRYATGAGPGFHFPLPGVGYLRHTGRNLTRITEFIKAQEPDIVGLVEVDMGSVRSGLKNQAEVIAGALGHYHAHECKYSAGSMNQRLPIVRKQGNAFLTSNDISGARFHYFDAGIKRLIIELELDEFSVFLVHLSVKYRHRHYQLRHLHSLVKKTRKPTIVAGDFNTLWGDYEIELFREATGLVNANSSGAPSYPSRWPRKQLDFIFHSPEFSVSRFEIPEVTFSDHLPLVCDLELTGRG